MKTNIKNTKYVFQGTKFKSPRNVTLLFRKENNFLANRDTTRTFNKSFFFVDVNQFCHMKFTLIVKREHAFYMCFGKKTNI